LALNCPEGKCSSAWSYLVADAELDEGVLAVLGLDEPDVLAAVGRERVVLPDGEQLGLDAECAHAAHDQSAAAEERLGDLRLAGVGVVVDPCPVLLGDLRDDLGEGLGHPHPIE
jgi:hypothetical protein